MAIPGDYMSPSQNQESNRIDEVIKACMMEAEHKCRKLKTGEIQFSETTVQPRREMKFWKLAIKRREGHYVRSRQWSRAKEKANITMDTSGLSIPDMQKARNTAYVAYRTARKSHIENRLTFLDNFDPKIRKRLLHTEEQRRQGRVSRWINQKMFGGSVIKTFRSDIIEGVETVTECSTKDEINAVLMEVNESKYKQCGASPFLQEPLLSDFGFSGTTARAAEVLAGTYTPPPGTDPFACLLLQNMSIPPNVAAIPVKPAFVSTESHQASWKRAKEYTTAGRSGIHFGQYKAQALDNGLAALDASRRSIHYSTGETLDRWKDGVDVMLTKASGDLRAHKLRTIILMEADFNMNNKQLSRDGMHHAEATGCIAPEQTGGRRKHRANETSLVSTLISDDSRSKRKAMAVCSNDAKGCYDRIVHSVAVICLQRLGFPASAIQSMIKTIQQMRHFVRTGFGDSEESYGPSLPPDIPLMGLLQGNGVAGAGWTAVSSSQSSLKPCAS